MPIQIQEASRTPNRHGQIRASPRCIIVKTISTENKERILKSRKEKNQIKCKVKAIKITADFSTEALKAKRAWSEVFQAPKENHFNPRILYPASNHSKLKEE
jgi:hypothetical protein